MRYICILFSLILGVKVVYIKLIRIMRIESKTIASVCVSFVKPSRKRSTILKYFTINPDDETTVICVICEEAVCHGGKDSKIFITTNMQSHLRQAHSDKFDELDVKQHDEANKNEEQIVKQRNFATRPS